MRPWIPLTYSLTAYEVKMKISNIIVRDRLHRIVASQLEKKRCALTMILNGKLEGATWSHRVRAMVELNRLPKHSDPNRIIDRCTETGRYRVSWKHLYASKQGTSINALL